jgi:hypothetical protein
MSRQSRLNAVIDGMLSELEYELEAEFEVGALTYRWVVSHSPDFGGGYNILDSLSTGAEVRTPDDARFRQSAVIQMAFKTLKAQGQGGILKLERFIQQPDGRWTRDKADDACETADLSSPFLRRRFGCWP